MTRLVIFDLDGTLCNTTRAMSLCGNWALEELGFQGFEQSAYGGFSGGGIDEYVNAILEAAGDREHRYAERFWHLYLKRQSELREEANIPYDGIKQLLESLKKRGVRLALLSNKDHETCVEIAETVFGVGVFDAVRGDQRSIPVKPDPAGVFALLDQLCVPPEDTLYIGDTEVDMKTGKNAGLRTVAALWGYRSRETLAAYSPYAMIETPSQLLDLL